jgi:hypothetical protein
MATDWTEVIKVVFGPLIGAAIALLSIWLKEMLDRRRNLQAWYEDQYVRNGLDQISSHIMAVKYNLVANPDNPSIPAEMLILPVEAITKIRLM